MKARALALVGLLAPACVAGPDEDRTGAPARVALLECHGESCRCEERGGRCTARSSAADAGYWFYDDATECGATARCGWTDAPPCSGNVDEHVWLVDRGGGGRLASFDDAPRDPRRGLLGCGGRVVTLAEGDCGGRALVRCWLQTRWNRDEPSDPRAYLFDAIDDGRGCERLAEPADLVVVACLDKNDDGDTDDPGERSAPLDGTAP